MKTITRVLAVLAFAGWAGNVPAASITGADIVTVDGKDWAQVDLFTNLSWNDINAVCPSGVCIDGGTLNGYEVTNYIWASVNEVNDLFNNFIGSPALGPGPTFFDGADDSTLWADQFLASFNSTRTQGAFYDGLFGLTSELLNPNNNATAQFYNWRTGNSFNEVDSVQTDIYLGTNNAFADHGAFLYYAPPQSGVPAPATLALFGLGLAGLGWTRRKKT